MSLKRIPVLVFSFLFSYFLSAQTDPNYPNILLVIADDLGVDVSNGYHQGNLMPTTPTLDSLRNVGLTFDNVFSAPVCSPTRAAIMSGKYGVKNGVTGVPGNLDLSHTSLFDRLEEYTNDEYSKAVIGKWHISSPVNTQHPMEHGVDYYMGVISGAVPDYFDWNKTENGVITSDTNYVTSVFTDASIDWIESRDSPWFLWLAHVAPHTPYHVPPAELYSINTTGSNFRKYIAMIESLDHELNRTLYAMSPEVRANTLVIFVGDNGTPGNVLQDYPSGHGKGTLYQGGIRVPMIIAGAGVTRKGEREDALVHLADIHATILEAAGEDLPGGIDNSLSFYHLLSGDNGATRAYNHSENGTSMGSDNNGWTIRNDRYKLINFEDGVQEFYDLVLDSLEVNNLLLTSLTIDEQNAKDDLELEADIQRSSWSCRDYIQNGDEEGIDCGGSFCATCMSGVEEKDHLKNVMVYPNPNSGVFTITSENESIQRIEFYSLNGELLGKELFSSGIKKLTATLPTDFLQFTVVKIVTDRRIYCERIIQHN